MTNLQKIQQETQEIFLKMFDYTTKHDLDTSWAVLLDKEDKNPAGKEQLLDLLHSRESIAYKAGLEEVREKIKEIINKKEQVHGFQPYTTGNEEFERKVFFDGFDDGRAMMKIDLLNLIKSVEQAQQLIKQ